MLQSSSSLRIQYQRRAVSCSFVLLLFLTQIHSTATLIVPNEVPSILSLVYSNIPPIKKGTDSRLGFGFRLGEHADFQILVELGPQKETRPIGDQDTADGSSFNKRQVSKGQQLRVQQEMSPTEHSPATWLEKWSNDITTSSKNKTNNIKKKEAEAYKKVGLPTMPPVPDQSLRQLQMLYKMATSSTSERTLASSEAAQTLDKVDAATHLQERLKAFKAPTNAEELQTLRQKPVGKAKTEITKELMDVNLDAE